MGIRAYAMYGWRLEYSKLSDIFTAEELRETLENCEEFSQYRAELTEEDMNDRDYTLSCLRDIGEIESIPSLNGIEICDYWPGECYVIGEDIQVEPDFKSRFYAEHANLIEKLGEPKIQLFYM